MIDRHIVYHYRYNTNGNLTRTRKDWSNNGGVTVAFIPTDDKEYINIGISRCNENDNFCKRYGNTRALGRASSYQSPCIKNVLNLSQLGELGCALASSGATTTDEVLEFFEYCME